MHGDRSPTDGLAEGGFSVGHPEGDVPRTVAVTCDVAGDLAALPRRRRDDEAQLTLLEDV